MIEEGKDRESGELFGNLELKIDNNGNIISEDMVHSIIPPHVLLDGIYKISTEIYDYMLQRDITSVTLVCMDNRSVPLSNLIYFLLGEVLYDMQYVFFDKKSKLQYTTLKSDSIQSNNFLIVDMLINSGNKMKTIVDMLNNCGANSVTTVAFLKKNNSKCKLKNINFHAIIDIEPSTMLVGFGLTDKKGYFGNLNTFTTMEELAKIKYKEAGDKLEHLYEPLTPLEVEYENLEDEDNDGKDIEPPTNPSGPDNTHHTF